MRRSFFTAMAVGATLMATSLPTPVGAAVAAPRAVSAGFTQRTLFSVSSPTTIDALPDGRLVILEQGGSVRIRTASGSLLPQPALTIPTICVGSERGLLGFTALPDLDASGYVYLYFTRQKASAPGGCVNRVSRFTMTGNTISWDSQKVIVDNISSVNGNHNGGDIAFGKDGYLYIAVGDAGSDPRGDSGSAGGNDAAQDRSLLNGKILRVTATGRPAPGNPFTGEGTARCARRGNTPSTPTTICQEIFAYGLRNPYRFVMDPAAPGTRFFVNDVGQGTYEEVNRGRAGANYGWPMREGRCPQGDTPPCPRGSKALTGPIEAYGRDLGQYVTGGAFVPVGSWPDSYEGGYLFGDGGSGTVWFRDSAGDVDWDAPFATGLSQLSDMVAVRRPNGTVTVFYTLSSGAVGRITAS